MRTILNNLISFYQRTLSPDHSLRGKARYPYGYCKFYPSCSEYAKQALQSHGTVRGLFLAGWRVLRCNPFTRGGFDPATRREI